MLVAPDCYAYLISIWHGMIVATGWANTLCRLAARLKILFNSGVKSFDSGGAQGTLASPEEAPKSCSKMLWVFGKMSNSTFSSFFRGGAPASLRSSG